MDYLPKVFDAWSSFDHPNIIPLLAVMKVVRGCYVIMPQMTGIRIQYNKHYYYCVCVYGSLRARSNIRDIIYTDSMIME